MSENGEPADLTARFRRLIRRHGPMSVARYMGESNALYYAGRDPLGAPRESGGGDFITAPEISQMFGEMVGLWLADIWARAGRPAGAIYVELGPGRGTLARDALRAMATQGLTPEVHLVEASPALRKAQAGVLAGAHFHHDLGTLPEGRPVLLAANEFLDALPVRQLVRTPDGWRERMIALEDGHFVFVAGEQPMDTAVPDGFADEPAGTIVETCPAACALVQEVARRVDLEGGAALFVDYGHLTPRTGSTLQAVRRHRKIDVFAAPGDADLTAHVDLVVLERIARRAGLATATATQGAWLTAMGLDLRAQALAGRTPERADEIAAARHRLTAPDQMGELFKVMAVTARDWPRGSGFADGPISR